MVCVTVCFPLTLTNSWQGSDHCPVYGVLKEKIVVEGKERHILDMVNPAGLFINGSRQHSQPLPKLRLSARLFPEFGGRRTIKEMFTTSSRSPKLAPSSAPSSAPSPADGSDSPDAPSTQETQEKQEKQETRSTSQTPGIPPATKQAGASGPPPSKRRKTTAMTTVGRGSTKQTIAPGQQSLIGFFKSNVPVEAKEKPAPTEPPSAGPSEGRTYPVGQPSPTPAGEPIPEEWGFVDPEASRESWSRILAKPASPLCDQHREPCIQRVTKKPGPNCGRSFWMCSRLDPFPAPPNTHGFPSSYVSNMFFFLLRELGPREQTVKWLPEGSRASRANGNATTSSGAATGPGKGGPRVSCSIP